MTMQSIQDTVHRQNTNAILISNLAKYWLELSGQINAPVQPVVRYIPQFLARGSACGLELRPEQSQVLAPRYLADYYIDPKHTIRGSLDEIKGVTPDYLILIISGTDTPQGVRLTGWSKKHYQFNNICRYSTAQPAHGNALVAEIIPQLIKLGIDPSAHSFEALIIPTKGNGNSIKKSSEVSQKMSNLISGGERKINREDLAACYTLAYEEVYKMQPPSMPQVAGGIGR